MTTAATAFAMMSAIGTPTPTPIQTGVMSTQIQKTNPKQLDDLWCFG